MFYESLKRSICQMEKLFFKVLERTSIVANMKYSGIFLKADISVRRTDSGTLLNGWLKLV